MLAAFPLSGIILGIINIAIVIAILLLIGAIIMWFGSWLGFTVPELVQRLYLILVALIALYMLVGLVFGVVPVPSLTGLRSGLT